MKARTYLLVIGLLTTLSCNNDADIGSSVSIKERIANDIIDGLSDSSDLVLDDRPLPNTKYAAEKAHSSISFHTRHWEIVRLIGWFDNFEVVMYSDLPDWSDAVIYARAFPKTIRMPNMVMAGGLQSDEYLDTEKYPELTFVSDSLVPIETGNHKLYGQMTIKGVTKAVILDVDFLGLAYPGEQSICGFHAMGSINRKEFGIAPDFKLHSGRDMHDHSIFFDLDLRMEKS